MRRGKGTDIIACPGDIEGLEPSFTKPQLCVKKAMAIPFSHGLPHPKLAALMPVSMPAKKVLTF